ncbi:MAG: nitroreductase [Proteobacteria bacterium]|nr:nitroreductase [Pseudomonadota bacterium]
MELFEAIKTRKSIREFKSDPVSKEILKEILEISTRAPSAVNRQPWEFVVIAGEVLEKIKQANVERLNTPQSDRDNDGRRQSGPHIDRESVYRKRQVDLAKELFRLMDIPREDKEKRAAWAERGFRYFDAPAAIILVKDVSISAKLSGYLDVGSVTQTICLTALEYGLGTCIESQGIAFPEVLREHAGIPDSKEIVMSVAIGYPNWDFPANKIETPREEVDNITTWCGFK